MKGMGRGGKADDVGEGILKKMKTLETVGEDSIGGTR